MRFQCFCGSRADAPLEFCPTCGQMHSYYPIVDRPQIATLLSSPVLSGAALVQAAGNRVHLPGHWRAVFPEGVFLPCFILLWGTPGSGKTTLALNLAQAYTGRVIVLPFETGLSQALAQLARRIECVAPDFCVPSEWDEIVTLIASYDLIVVDSLQRAGVDVEFWRAATVHQGKTLLATSEVNASGDVRGGLAASHLADVSIELPEYGRFIVRKNRAGGLYEGMWL